MSSIKPFTINVPQSKLDDLRERLGRLRAIHPRSVQRHFLEAMGLTAKRLDQIRRACRAIELLAQGKRAVDVALELGYSDQSHMTRALKAIMGRTPGEVSRGPS